ncbi:MAG: GNAT family N-acetyltransferase [Alistipes sp.]|nr:GNAT family N-acetyltransferase [Alistipes sp.]
MIRLCRIRTRDTALYRFMEELLAASFPQQEYRPLDALRETTDCRPAFANHVVCDDDRPVGLLTWWDFEGFRYVEHFAILSSLRNAGYGRRVLELLARDSSVPLVLEAEAPETETARRRIAFYERAGFAVWDREYRQPPYRPGDGFLPMWLLVRGAPERLPDRRAVCGTIYREVYGLKGE